MTTLTQYIAVDATPAQQDRTRTGPAGDAGPDLPVPFEIECRFATKRDLYLMLDYWTDKCSRLERLGDTAGLERADRCHRIVFEEIDRRDAIVAEKERRRQARMRTAAAIFRETGQVRV